MTNSPRPPKHDYIATLRIKKTGRHGKTVTVIEELPKNERFLKDLTYLLRTTFEVETTFEVVEQKGIIEILGDRREAIRKIFIEEGIPYKK